MSLDHLLPTSVVINNREVDVNVFRRSAALSVEEFVSRCAGCSIALVRCPSASSYCGLNIEPSIISAVCMLGYIPDTCDMIAVITDEQVYEGRTTYSTKRLEAEIKEAVSADDLLQEILQVASNIEYVYDWSGKAAAAIPADTFAFAAPDIMRARTDRNSAVSCVRPIAEAAIDEVHAAKIAQAVADERACDFIQAISAPSGVRARKRKCFDEKTVFDCFCLGYCEFPVNEQEIADILERIEGKRKEPTASFIDVFYDAALCDGKASEDAERYRYAKKFFCDAIVLWDYSLEDFGVPLTVRDWECLFDNKRNWRKDAMKQMAHLIGVDCAIEALSHGVSVGDLTA